MPLQRLIRLTTLVDNFVRAPGLVAQHGFSLLVEGPFGRILFDTGATGEVLAHNAQSLNVKLSQLDHIVLSHGHWDHGGALLRAMDESSARLWIPEGALLPRFHGRGDGARDIALPQAVRQRLVQDRKRWEEVSGPRDLAEGVRLTGPIPGIRPEWSHAGLWRSALLDVPDDVPEEQALVLEAPDGLVAVVGCSHFGIANLLAFLTKEFPGRRLLALVGGLHLESAPEPALHEIARGLKSMGLASFHPTHCSGWDASSRLATLLEQSIAYGRVGQILTF